MGCINYNCIDPLGQHTLNQCGYERQGGAANAIIFECGSLPQDPSDGNEINTLISNGKATVLRNVNISYEAASPVEIDSNIPCQPSKVINYDRSGKLIDTNINSSNVDFYNKLFSGRVIGGMIIEECGNDDDPKAKYIDKPITFTGSDILPATDKEWQKFEATFKWKSREPNVKIINVPVGVF